MIGKIKKMRLSMAESIIGVIILALVLFGLIVSIIGALLFTTSFRNEYNTSTFHMADTAATLVHGDHLSSYLKGENMEEYQETKRHLDDYCKNIHVSLVYVIQVDRSDYGRFVSIFNSVNNSVDNTSYKEWELGYKRDTTNQEYRDKYKSLYQKKAPYENVFRIRTADGQHPHITTLVPVEDSKGEVVGILCMQRPISELSRLMMPYFITVGLATLIISVLVATLVARFIRKQFINPVLTVSREATRFASENKKGKELGWISRFAEIDDLAKSIDTMETDMVAYMDNLTAATAEKERIGAELSLASNIQENTLPNHFPAFPDREDFDIYASMTPAKEVGGDFYNFILIDDDHLALIMGDVSGKGVPGALFMMVSNLLLDLSARMPGTPGQILSYVNDNICMNNKADMFVTVWLGMVELSTGKMMMANAGHEDIALYKQSKDFELLKTKHGLVIGAWPGSQYKDIEVQLEPGDKIFVYTDGVPEATNADFEMFGTQRMIQSLNSVKEGTPKEMLEQVYEDVNAFVGKADQFDDLTMLGFEYKGK
ncbi:MAG: SpoIIE family protein phosphatase [Erysipelotrichaceae bacterium]|nr:SpoIIE family protein phosphatase [Erysipelotrichaceae bacterium]